MRDIRMAIIIPNHRHLAALYSVVPSQSFDQGITWMIITMSANNPKFTFQTTAISQEGKITQND